MTVDVHQSWKPFLQHEFGKPYFKDLIAFVSQEYNSHQCFPKASDIFNAFNHCHFDDTKVVIIGQDPYHGDGQANGLCFSVNDGIKHPPSLINIFKEIENDLGITYPLGGNLMAWADQGVLLLNATLTVRAHQAGSHQKEGWEQFTDNVIIELNKDNDPKVFVLWGNNAIKKELLITNPHHLVLSSSHPSPLSARHSFFGSKVFTKINDFLRKNSREIIDFKII